MASVVNLDFIEREETFYGGISDNCERFTQTYVGEKSLNNPENDLLVPDSSEQKTLDNEKSTNVERVESQICRSFYLYGTKQTLKNDFWNQPYGIKSLGKDFLRYENPTQCMDFYTFAKMSGVFNKCDSYKKNVNKTDVELHPILKNNNITASKRNVQFGFPMAWMRYYTNDMDDSESTASTELLFSDDEQAGNGEMCNDQEVPSNANMHGLDHKRICLDNAESSKFCPVFKFPDVVYIPPLNRDTMTQLCEQSSDKSIVSPASSCTPGKIGGTSKEQKISPNSLVQAKCANELSILCEADLQKHSLNDICLLHSGESITKHSRQETLHPNDHELEPVLPNPGTETGCGELQRVPQDSSCASGNTLAKNDSLLSHRLCSSVFYLDEGAYIDEITLSPVQMSDNHRKIWSAQQVLENDEDESFYNETNTAGVPTMASCCTVRNPELPEFISVVKNQGHTEESFQYADIDVESCSSQISLTSSTQDHSSPVTLETTSLKITEPIDDTILPTEEHELQDEPKNQFKSVQESLDELEGPELLLMAMELVKSALKKSKKPTKNEGNGKTECVPAIAPKAPSPVFSWKKFTYQNQSTLPHDDAEPVDKADPVPQQFNKYTKLYLNNICTRPIRLGLSRRRTDPMDHRPYNIKKPETTIKMVHQ